MRSYLKTNDYFLTQKEFELRYDGELDMLVTHPQPADLDTYYNTETYISHSDGKTTLLEKVYQGFKKINLDRKLGLLEKVVKGQKIVLDVGAGTGDFLLHAKNRNWQTFGMEPNEKARQLSEAKGLFLEPSLKAFEGKKFQCITLWHVLEHLPDLKQNIGQLSELLDDNGTLVVAVPNFKSFDAKYYSQFWAAYDVPRHLWHFSKNSIAGLFAVEGMKVVETKPMWFDSFYVSLLSEEYKTGKKNWFMAIIIGFWSNLRGVFTKEYSSHIYIIQKANTNP